MTVSKAVRDFVFDRDRQCLAARLDKSHRCADVWGVIHAADDIRTMTIEHVREEPG